MFRAHAFLQLLAQVHPVVCASWHSGLACPPRSATRDIPSLESNCEERLPALEAYLQGFTTNLHHAINAIVVRSQFTQDQIVTAIALRSLAALGRLVCGAKYTAYYTWAKYVDFVEYHCAEVRVAVVELATLHPEVLSPGQLQSTLESCSASSLFKFLDGSEQVIFWVSDALGLLKEPHASVPVFLQHARLSPLTYPASMTPTPPCRQLSFASWPPELVLKPRMVRTGKWGPPGVLPMYVIRMDPRRLLGRVDEVGIQRSQWIIDLGAKDIHTTELMELINDGTSAVLIEGDLLDSNSSTHLYDEFRLRPDICLVSKVVEPDELHALLAMCMERWSALRRLDGTPVAHTQLGLDWLKVDVDNGGCDFLKSVIQFGLQPLVVQVELRDWPAPLFFWQRFERNATCQYDTPCEQYCLMSQDCSIASALAILIDYVPYPVPLDTDVIFLRKDVAERLALGTFEGGGVLTSLEAYSRDRWCMMFLHQTLFHVLETSSPIDQRLLMDTSMSPRERQDLLRESLAHHFPSRRFHWNHP